MSILAWFTAYLIVAMLAGSLAVALAHVKHRTWLLWGGICMFFPIFLPLLVLLPRREGPAPFEDESNGPGDDDPGWWGW